MHPKSYPDLLQKVILQLEIGYKNKPERLFYSKTKISEFIIDETQLKVCSEIIWLWVAIESESKEILSITISKERKICLWQSIFYRILWKNIAGIQFQLQTVWYLVFISILQVFETKTSFTFFYEKSIIERTM